MKDYLPSRAKTALFLLTILILTLSAAPATQEQETRIVVAEGVSALIPGKSIDRAFDEAVKDAKRNAVQMGIGVLVNSQTIVDNYELISDKILTRSSGYVRHFEVISRNSDGDLYRVVIKAEVAVADIHSDLAAVLILKAEKGYPRIMLIGIEKVGEQQKTSLSAQTAMEEFLVKKGFDLVDESQVEIVKARDVALHPEDHKTAAALGQRFGAEIIVVYQAIADYEGTSNAYGMNLNSFRGTLDARIIYTDTADLLGSVSASDYAAAEGRPAAVRLAFQKTARKAAPLVMEKILDDWQKHVNKLDLVISGLNYVEMKKIKEALSVMRRVDAVGSGEFEKGVAMFHIQGDITPGDLADRLLEIDEIPGLQIIAVSSGRVEARIKR